MATIDDVAALALALPDVTEGARYGHRTWFVHDKAFAWERPFSKADHKRAGTEALPDGPIAALAVDDLADKEAVLAAATPGVFTIPHFDGYAAILVELDVVGRRALRELVTDAWLCTAPPALAADLLARRRRR